MDEIFERLKSKEKLVRLDAARDLRRYVEQLNNEISSNIEGRVLVEKVNKRLSDLVRSRNNAEAWGGLVAISSLLDLDGEGRLHLFRYYNYVKALLPNDDVSLMAEASKTLGKIAGSGGASFGERFMEKEVPAAVVMLGTENQRFAGVLILKELALRNTTFFQAHLPLVLDSILLPLRDHRITVRENGADLLAACLDILSQRETTIREKHLSHILDDAGRGLKQLQPEVIHGSLLTYRELFRHGGMFMQDAFSESAERIRACKSHKDVLIRKTVISLIPILAEYDTQSFTSNFIGQSMNHLLSELTNPEDQAEAFIAIGQTATAVRSDIKPYLEPIMQHIRTCLSSTGKKHPIPEAAVFKCIGLLAAAVGPHLTKLVQDILNLMFSRGLSEPLVEALDEIVHYIPPLVRPVQEHLLDLLSIVLSGRRYHQIGAPPSDPGPKSVFVKKAQTPNLVKLALTTLGKFDFTGHPLNEIILDSVLPYLEHKDADVRRASALTTSLLLAHDPICYQSSSHSLEVISTILTKLISAGVADLDSDVRLTVLRSLQSPFDKHLSQAENIQALFIALDDEVFENRLAAVSLVGRLARHNPAYILPSLRKALIQLLTELEYSTSQRGKEQCTQLLALLLSVTHRLIKPYALPMLRVLLQKAEDPNPAVSAYVILCLGELAAIVGEEGSKHIPELMQVVVPRITDSIPARQEAAIRALGQVCSNMGYVIQPMLDYPDILERLTGLLEGEPTVVIRREVLKVLGVFGALDPLKIKNRRDETTPRPNQPANGTPGNGSPSPDDFFQDVVFKTLLRVFDDRNLSHYYPNVTEAIMSIFKTQGLRCAPVLSQIIPAFFKIMRQPGSRLGFYLEQLTVLVGIVKLHIRGHVHDICSLLAEFWDHTTFHLPIIALIESLGRVMKAEFKSCLPIVLPLLLKAFDDDANQLIQSRILDTIAAFGGIMEDYLYLILPAIIRSAERSEGTRLTIQTQKKAVQCLHILSKQINLSDHASRLILPLARLLSAKSNELSAIIMDTLSSFVLQLQSEYAIFVPTVQKCIEENHVSHARYQILVDKLIGGQPLPHEDHATPLALPEYSAAAEPTAMSVNQQQLRSVWDTSSVRTSEDWSQWFHTVMIEFIKESPSHALRACMTLSDMYSPLARELFKPGFLSCWNDLTDDHQENLMRTIEHAMTSPKTPQDIVLSLLDLAEYMEHEGKTLPLEAKLLGDLAMCCSAYAKALHYKELEYLSDPSPHVIESLISINTRLQQHDAAWGTLVIARDRYDISKHEEWYERLGHWEEALVAYEARATTDPNNFDVTVGRMKCLHALGEWEELASKVGELWQHVDLEIRREVAPMAAASAWALNSWDLVDTYSSAIRATSPERPFYRAILAVHRNQFTKALGQVSKARDVLSSEFKSISGEGYSRAYNSMVRVQMLSELEEVLSYKQYADQPDRQTSMQRMWMKRLEGCQPDVDVWQRVLQVRRLVLNPQDDTSSWIKFANLSRRSGRMSLAEKTLNSLIPNNHHHKASPEVIYAQLKYMWDDGKRNGSLQFLRQFTSSLAKDVQNEAGDSSSKVTKPKLDEMTKLLARCYLKQGEWQCLLDDDWGTRDTEDILNSYHSATHFDPDWYKAWHTWAMANFDIVQFMETQITTPTSPTFSSGGVIVHVVHAIDGFFRSISLRTEERLQDTLRLLTLYFKYGSTLEVDRVMAQGIPSVNVETWIDVIPQIIARIQTPYASIRQNVNHIMTIIGRHHPQALVFPLAVASSSSSSSRRHAALSILERMREHSSKVVSEAVTISHELLRVAVLWTEQWHDGLEEASKLFFADKNPEGMIATLEPLHRKMDAGPTTTDEAAFIQSYGKNLHEASEACRRWRVHDDGRELDKAWDLYYLVYVKTKKHIDKLSSLELQYVSPILLEAKNLDLAVPGTYRVGKPLVKITGFEPKLSVIKSKQHPRKLIIKGSDGKDYTYGLKGHEDLRLDERVMQFFGLVNSLLALDPESYKRRLHIQRYPVIPLDPNAGLMGWVQNSDTLHVLIQEYRHQKRVLINIEYRLMTQMAPDYELLPLLNKIEAFEDALDHTRGQDLYRILWLKSSNSEHWLERRTTYTRSLAVNSMVGHILGLGDRHPSNLLIARATGKVVHIDFGDCFEIAMHREAYPERVPFRLTRMLVYAMEVSRIEGSFRKTCEISMNLLRENRESLLAVLEAFVYDPLINWRLAKTETTDTRDEGTSHSLREVTVSSTSKLAPHPQGHARKPKTDEKDIFNESSGQTGAQEGRNEKALSAYNRVQQKLTGRDFDPDVALPVDIQVEQLIQQATAVENLCQAFMGWCAFW